MKILLLILAFVFPYFLPAQTLEEPPLLQPGYQLSGAAFTFGIISEGSQYFLDEWLPGDVVLTSGAVVGAQLLRYNGYLDELIWLPSMARSPVQADRGLIRQFTLRLPADRDPVVFVNMAFHPGFQAQGAGVYAQQLHSGNIMLLAHRRVVPDGKVTRRSGNKIFHLPVLKAKPVYYFILPDGEIRSMEKIRPRLFEKLFPEMRDEIRESLRMNRIRMRSEKELIRIITSLDTLFMAQQKSAIY